MASRVMTVESHGGSVVRNLFSLIHHQETYWDSLTTNVREQCVNRQASRKLCEYQAYDPAGPMREKWDTSLYPGIRDVLNRERIKIFSRAKAEVCYAFHLYMIEQKAEIWPAFVAICIDVEVAKLVVKIVKRHLKSDNIGLKYLVLKSLLFSTGGGLPSRNVCGLAIDFIKHSEMRLPHEGFSGATSTMGGCILVNGEAFGLTTAHQLTGTTPTQYGEIEMTDEIILMSESDEDSESDNMNSSTFLNTDGLEKKAVQDHRRKNSDQVRGFDNHSDFLTYKWVQHGSSGMPLQLLADDMSTLICQNNVVDDWLLIPLGGSAPRYTNRIPIRNKDGQQVQIRGPSNERPLNQEVYLCLGVSIPSRANLRTTMSGLYLPSAKVIIDVYTCDQQTVVGDSGSWVANQAGYLIGSILACCKDSYVVPVETTIESISKHNPGLTVTFPWSGIDRLELSLLCRNFILIPYGDISGCAQFAQANPQIFYEETDAMLDEAKTAFSERDFDLADRCLQRVSMIRFYRDYPEKRRHDYITKLNDGRSKIGKVFWDYFNQIRQVVAIEAIKGGHEVPQSDEAALRETMNMERVLPTDPKLVKEPLSKQVLHLAHFQDDELKQNRRTEIFTPRRTRKQIMASSRGDESYDGTALDPSSARRPTSSQTQLKPEDMTQGIQSFDTIRDTDANAVLRDQIRGDLRRIEILLHESQRKTTELRVKITQARSDLLASQGAPKMQQGFSSELISDVTHVNLELSSILEKLDWVEQAASQISELNFEDRAGLKMILERVYRLRSEAVMLTREFSIDQREFLTIGREFTQLRRESRAARAEVSQSEAEVHLNPKDFARQTDVTDSRWR